MERSNFRRPGAPATAAGTGTAVSPVTDIAGFDANGEMPADKEEDVGVGVAAGLTGGADTDLV